MSKELMFTLLTLLMLDIAFWTNSKSMAIHACFVSAQSLSHLWVSACPLIYRGLTTGSLWV